MSIIKGRTDPGSMIFILYSPNKHQSYASSKQEYDFANRFELILASLLMVGVAAWRSSILSSDRINLEHRISLQTRVNFMLD